MLSNRKENKVGKKIPIEEVKRALKELVGEQEGNNNQVNRAAFMQVGRFDQVRFIHEVQCHEDQIQEELSSSECLSDKSGDTESEPEFVTATGSASNNQTSSEESNLDEKVEEEHDEITQNDETPSDSGRDEYEEEMRKKSSVKKRK